VTRGRAAASCARVIFRERALPAPELQAELYADTARAISQLERDKALRAAGLKVVHFTWDQLFRQTERVIGWIRQAFSSPSAW